MFTGIIEEIGTVKSLITGADTCILTVSTNKILSDVKIGDSIAVNGTCLTVCQFNAVCFSADVMPETLQRTNLGKLTSGSSVNLERAMPADGRFGGHIVSGHIDGTGTLRNFHKDKNAVWVTISAKPDILKYIVQKGSISVDGVSLTVGRVSNDDFSVSVIPHTGQETTLLQKKAGDIINLECDIIAKYIEKLCPAQKTGITEDFLAEHGFV